MKLALAKPQCMNILVLKGVCFFRSPLSSHFQAFPPYYWNSFANQILSCKVLLLIIKPWPNVFWEPLLIQGLKVNPPLFVYCFCNAVLSKLRLSGRRQEIRVTLTTAVPCPLSFSNDVVWALVAQCQELSNSRGQEDRSLFIQLLHLGSCWVCLLSSFFYCFSSPSSLLMGA